MASNLQDLFDSVDGLADDVLETGVPALTIAVTGLAANFGIDQLTKRVALPDWAQKWAVPGGMLAAGVAAGMFLPKSPLGRKVGTNVGIGLAAAGLFRLYGTLSDQFGWGMSAPAVAGLGNQEVLLGLGRGEDLFQRYLGSAPVTAETVNGLSAAPVMVEELNGLATSPAPTTVEVLNGYGRGFGSGPGVAATFTG